MMPPLTPAKQGATRRAAVHAGVAIFAAAAVATLLISGPTQGWWYGLAWVGFPIIGALVLWRRPGNTIGWLLVLTGSCWSVALAGYSLVGSAPGRGPVGVELVGQICGYLGWILLTAIIVLFPTGRTQTRATRWLIRATALTGVVVVALGLVNPAPLESSQRRNPLGLTELEGLAGWFIDQGFVIVPLLMLGALVSLASRWRHSVGATRLQYRWFILSVGLALVAVVASLAIGEREGLLEILQTVLFSFGLNAIPVAIGIAVTRYRLYEIDRVVSRTTSYIVVTGVLLAVYAVTVTAVPRVLPGTSSSFSVAAATLAAAAVFRPLLTRVQGVVDRRFNRGQYDAQQTVDAFAGRLRDEVDPDEVSADLLAVLNRTVEPRGVALWVKDAS